MEPDYVKLKELKPTVAGYVKKAQSLLTKPPFPDEKAIHDIRVLLKKARSSLKLIASQPDMDYCIRDIKELKEAGQLMIFGERLQFIANCLKV